MTKIITLAHSLLLTLVVHADSRLSNDYKLLIESTNTGGQRAASGSYVNHCSIGEISAVSNNIATLQSGFLGKVYEVVGFSVTASSTSVDEGSFLQLNALELLDDGTMLIVPRSSVQWAIVSGPISGITTEGVAACGIVFQDTVAKVHGIFNGLTNGFDLIIQDSLDDNFGSYAADEISDYWQVQHFGLPPNSKAAPTEDPDGDGQDNRFEFTAGLVPTDPRSKFRFEISTVSRNGPQVELVFDPILSGRRYIAEYSLTLAKDSWFPLVGVLTVDSGAQRTITDGMFAQNPRKFYRVRVNKD